MLQTFLGSQPDVQEKAAELDKDPLQILGTQFSIPNARDRSKVVNLLKKIYTQTSFKDDIGAYVRVSSKFINFKPYRLFSKEEYSKGSTTYFQNFWVTKCSTNYH